MERLPVRDTSPRRKPHRLTCFDYSTPGIYFVTLCAKKKALLFGQLVEAGMCVTRLGGIAQACWLDIPRHFADVRLDQYVVMPNHIHGLLELSLEPHTGTNNPPSLATIVNQYKSAVTTRAVVAGCGLPGMVWQRGYYDHVVRDEHGLERIREYIQTNPLRWMLDRENPQRRAGDEFDRWLEATYSQPPR